MQHVQHLQQKARVLRDAQLVTEEQVKVIEWSAGLAPLVRPFEAESKIGRRPAKLTAEFNRPMSPYPYVRPPSAFSSTIPSSAVSSNSNSKTGEIKYHSSMSKALKLEFKISKYRAHNPPRIKMNNPPQKTTARKKRQHRRHQHHQHHQLPEQEPEQKNHHRQKNASMLRRLALKEPGLGGAGIGQFDRRWLGLRAQPGEQVRQIATFALSICGFADYFLCCKVHVSNNLWCEEHVRRSQLQQQTRFDKQTRQQMQTQMQQKQLDGIDEQQAGPLSVLLSDLNATPLQELQHAQEYESTYRLQNSGSAPVLFSNNGHTVLPSCC